MLEDLIISWNSCLISRDELAEPEFKWLKERAEGRKYRDTHFYESFLYEGVEYSLHDSVYLQVESDNTPNIGKLVQIWEEANKSKKIRVQWFFLPSEILYYLKDTEVLENELFLASGRGKGLVNISPLEALVGKCNVVCTSTDARNPQPSENEKKMADYVFYRVFDVQNFLILDQFNDTIGELKVEFVFNKKESLRALSSPKFESNKHDARKTNALEGTMRLVGADSPNPSRHSIRDCNHIPRNDDTNEKQVIERDKVSYGRKCTNVVNSSDELAATSIIDNRGVSGGSIIGCKTDVERGRVIERKSSLKEAQFEDNVDFVKSCGWEETSLKRRMLDDISSKDNGKTIDLTSNKCRQAKNTIKNEIASNDKNDGGQGNIENNKVKDAKAPLKNTCFGESVKCDSKSPRLNNTSSKRGKFDASSGEDGEETNNTGSTHVSHVKNVGDTCLKSGKLIDKSFKDNEKSSAPNSMAFGDRREMQVNSAIGFDANLKFETDKGSKWPRKELKPTKTYATLDEKILGRRTTSPKPLESEHVSSHVFHQKDLKSTKSGNASGGKSSKINDILVDEALKYKSHEAFVGRGQVATQIEHSSDAASQSSKTCLYPPNREINRGRDSFKRKDLSLAKSFCLGDAPSKRAKFDDHEKPSKVKNMEVRRELKAKNRGIGQEMLNHAHGACERNDLSLAKESCVLGPSQKTKHDGSSKTFKLNKNDIFQHPKEEIHNNKDGKVEGVVFEVTPMQIKEKRTWLKMENLSWQSTRAAHHEGKLVLLQNLDPSLTSAEVKDIIWHAFEEKCMAKMVQHSAMSSPHNGQALLIFNTREVAERVLKGLEDKCLILQDQRPLVGCTVLFPGYPRKQTEFVGHLSIDKVRRIAKRDTKEAVCTAHYSQPNTIEYEMAMEWSLLQSKSDIWCQNLFEQHKVELRKLVANLQVK